MATTETLRRSPEGGRSSAGSLLDGLIVAVVLLAIAGAAAIFFTVGVGLVDAERVIADPELRDLLLGPAVASEGWAWSAAIGGSLVVGLGAVALLFRRFAPGSGAGGPAPHILTADETGLVVVASEGVSRVAENSVVRNGGVLDAQVRVRGRGQSPVRLIVEAQVYGSADLERTGKQVREAARDAVERLVGLKVAEVVVKLEVVPPESLGRELE